MSQTKIVVLKRKKLLLGLLALLAVVALILFLTGAFRGDKKSPEPEPSSPSAKYVPGSYEAEVELGDYRMKLQVLVDSDRVKSCSLSYLDEAVETMYPLLPSALENLNKQLAVGTLPEEIQFSEDSKYTESYLLAQIQNILALAMLSEETE